MKRDVFYNLVNFINTTSVKDIYWSSAKDILLNIEKMPDLTIVEVADMCYVSTATISRLCRKLNYESFAEFKNATINNLQYFNDGAKQFLFDSQLPEKEMINEGKEIFKNHFLNVIDTLQNTYDHLNYDDIMFIVDKIHNAHRICFAGNYFAQTVAMQLQIELSYLGKNCCAMYPLQQQIEVVKELHKDDLIIVSSIAGSYFKENLDVMKAITKSKAYVIAITQIDDFPYMDKVDKVIKLGMNHSSLIGKFSLTYIFEILEALYHLKYENK